MPTFEQIITAEFDFSAMKELWFKLYTHPFVENLLQPIWAFIESLPPLAWAAIVGVLALVFSNFGKKLLLCPVFVGITALSFAGGATYIAPRLDALVGEWIPIDPMVVGIVVGVIGAILFLPIYFCLFAAGIGYTVYLFVYPVALTLFGDTTAMIVGLGAAIAVVVVAFIFRKWVEMGLTAIIGAYIAMLAVNMVVLLPALYNYIIWAVLAVQGLVVQIKTRRRS